MRLKRIKIVGFKSFADPTMLEFDAGITGVVGPNGCGKSNISDAFKWVFGESSMQALRGKKSEDFIFSGTTTRKALNYAEVTLTLSDVGGKLPLPYDEVEVTRRCHRDGNSEYFINRKLVRRIDLLDLFLDSGIGKNASSMVFEQGEADKLIRFSPLERRALFEEAAGTQRFHQRREEAVRKLAKTEHNMAPIREVHKEVQKQLETLEKQAQEAAHFKEKKEELQQRLKGLYSAKWHAIEEKERQLISKRDDQNECLTRWSGELTSWREKLVEQKKALQESEGQLHKYNEEVYKVRSDKEIRNREHQTANERLHESEKNEERWMQELARIDAKQTEATVVIVEATERKRELETESNAADAAAATQSIRVDALEKEVAAMRRDQRQCQQQRIEKLQKAGALEGEIKELTARLEGNQQRVTESEGRVATLNASLSSYKNTAQEKEREVADLTQSVNKQKSHLAELEQQQEDLVSQLTEMENTFDQLQQQQAQAQGRLDALQRLQKEMEGFSSGSQRLLEEASDTSSPLYGLLQPLYPLIKAKEGSSEALLTILRSYSQTLVTATSAHCNTILTFARDHDLKDFSLLCLEKLRAHANAAPIAGATLFDAVIAPEVESLFDHTYSVGDSDTAYRLVATHPGVEAWITDGTFLDNKGVLFSKTQGEHNPFAREAEIRNLERHIAQLEEQQSTLDQAIEEQQERRAAIQMERGHADKELRRIEMRLVESNFALQNSRAEITRSDAESRTLKEELHTLRATIETLSSQLEARRDAHHSAAKAAAEVEASATQLAATLSKKEPHLEEESAHLIQQQHHAASLKSELARLNHQIQLFKVQQSERNERRHQLEQERVANRQLQEQFKEKGQMHADGLEAVEKSLSVAMKRCSELEGSVAKQRSAIEKVEMTIAKVAAKMEKGQQDENKLEIAAAQLETSRNALTEELNEQFQMTFDALLALDIPIDGSIEEAEKVVRALRREVEKAQESVNMTSIEELTQQQERDHYLNEQLTDLTESKEELLKIIEQLESECRTLFNKTFATVRENFQKNFAILFNGGEADLKIEGKHNDAGVEIIAKPPGKKMRSINLLSGGEKCLTAVALLFAIFEVKPAPFCILDEIDAPLDDSNVDRFLNIVKQFTDRCQFIIITHNKRTMTICDRLFGVSMEEKGVSKLLSMEFIHGNAPILIEA